MSLSHRRNGPGSHNPGRKFLIAAAAALVTALSADAARAQYYTPTQERRNPDGTVSIIGPSTDPNRQGVTFTFGGPPTTGWQTPTWQPAPYPPFGPALAPPAAFGSPTGFRAPPTFGPAIAPPVTGWQPPTWQPAPYPPFGPAIAPPAPYPAPGFRVVTTSDP